MTVVMTPGFLRHIFFDECVEHAMPISEPGAAVARAFSPFGPGDEDRLEACWENTQAMLDWMERHAPETLDGHLQNLRGLGFLDASSDAWGPVELARLHSVAGSLAWILAEVHPALRAVNPVSEELDHLQRVRDILAAHCANGGFHLAAAADSPLARARVALRNANDAYMELERRQRAETAARLGLEPVRLRSDVTLSARDPRVEDFRNAPEMQEVENSPHQVRFRFTVSGQARQALERLLAARGECTRLEAAGIVKLQQQIVPCIEGVRRAKAAAGLVDLYAGRARWARKMGACRPRLSSGAFLEAADAVHPYICAQVERLGRQYQKLSFCLKPPVVSLTGANMGGKTAFLRTVGLFQVLFQKGYYMPARHFSGMLFRSMAWIGAAPDAPRLGLSSFGRECRDLAQALSMPSPRLWLVDELARSTAVEEGMAIAGALMDELHTSGAPNCHVFAGHIQNPPCRFADAFQHLHTGGLDFDAYRQNALTQETQDALAASMDYRIYDGRASGSDALRIAAALGLPASLVRSAESILQSIGGVKERETLFPHGK